MLPVDLTKTDHELSQYISARCAAFGVVRSVTIHRHPTPFALVEMSIHYQTFELAAEHGGSAFGSSVLLHLEQEDRAV